MAYPQVCLPASTGTGALFLQQISQTEPVAWRVVIEDQVGCHLPEDDVCLPANKRRPPLPPDRPTARPPRTQLRRKTRRPRKDEVCDRLDSSLRKLEGRIIAALRPWHSDPAKVAQLIGFGWNLDGLNSGAQI